MNQQMTIAPGILPGIRSEDLKEVNCKNCGEDKFIAISEIRYASRFQSATGRPMVVNFQGGFACAKCAAINQFDIEGVDPVKDGLMLKDGKADKDKGNGTGKEDDEANDNN